jgi:hypothetical protein
MNNYSQTSIEKKAKNGAFKYLKYFVQVLAAIFVLFIMDILNTDVSTGNRIIFGFISFVYITAGILLSNIKFDSTYLNSHTFLSTVGIFGFFGIYYFKEFLI